MRLRTETITIDEFEKNKVQSLVDCRLDLLYIKRALSPSVLPLASLFENDSIFAGNKIQISDGYFYPLPYAAAHAAKEGGEEHFVENYFSSAHHFIEHFSEILSQELSDSIFNLMSSAGVQKENLLMDSQKRSFAPFNIRNLNAGGNGILIHCENSFLNELECDFRNTLYDLVDIENALSFLFILKAPEEGGELILFDRNWSETPIMLNECSMDDRHMKNIQLFTNKGFENPEHIRFPAVTGDLIIFRAAQIWHTVNSVAGGTNRISIGTFVAPDKYGQLKYWA